jgi:cardiolipin synthase
MSESLTMHHVSWITAVLFVIDLMIRVGLSVRVVMRRLPVGVTLAWLAVILPFPFLGAVCYLFVGEYRLGRGREQRIKEIAGVFGPWRTELEAAGKRDPADLGLEAAELARVAQSVLAAPPLAGNQLQLLEDANASFPPLLIDIDGATRSVDLEFYIWSPGGKADEVGEALLRAAGRGVACRVLVDALGSAAFLGSRQAAELREGGVQVAAALPASLWQSLQSRPDLRMHRKIVVIDGAIGYTGSLNLADPLLFKREAGVGQWVDALVRVRGPAVAVLGLTFLGDWAVATAADPQKLRAGQALPAAPGPGQAVVQVLASGPALQMHAIEQVVLMAVYDARHELVLTTPYFLPSESMLTALTSAAARGVQVSLIVPARVDSRLVHYASRAYQSDLLEAGVQVHLYQGGLLHTKSIAVDRRISFFGSLNLDPRSMRLNFEITLLVYDHDFTAHLRQLQQKYLDRAVSLSLAECQARSVFERLAENTTRLVGPIL